MANAYLKPLGLTLDSEVTVMDMWKRFHQDLLSPEMLPGQRNRYEPITLAVPAMVWQIALLSQDPPLIRQVRPAVEEMFERWISIASIWAGRTTMRCWRRCGTWRNRSRWAAA